MMKRRSSIRLYIGLFFIIGASNHAGAQEVQQPWDLPGINIISRAEWGADESIRIRSNNIPTRSGPDPIIAAAESYLLEKYPQDFFVSRRVSSIGAKDLTWSLSYSEKKKAIIIHHTASSRESIAKEGVLQHIRNIYSFHTLTRGRGDIGYNFLIDYDGNIYEGRYGGVGVIGAHTKRNNQATIGIALIGNYDEKEPSTKQWESLTKLTTQLALQHDINPSESVTFHQQTDTAPYIEHHTHEGIIGHQDAGTTSCPGSHVYEKLPQLKNTVNMLMLTWNNKYRIKEVKNIKKVIPINTSPLASITIPFNGENVAYCDFADNKQVQVEECTQTKEGVRISIKKVSKTVSGMHMIRIHDQQGGDRITYVTLQRDEDIKNLQQKRINTLIPTQQRAKESQKKGEVLTQQKIKILQDKSISILLYELTQKFLSRTIECNECILLVTDTEGESQKKTFSGSVFVEILDEQRLSVQTASEGRIAQAVSITPTDKSQTVQFTDYERKSYAGIPWNSFYGTITVQKESGTKTSEESFAVTNTLPLKKYIQGIVESNDQEHKEKNKIMAILSKQYAVHYLSEDNQHPNIPEGASYQGIDDPDQFQKYVGAGIEKTLTKRQGAVEETWDEYVLYDSALAFTPYFSCSPGITIAAQEKRGWTDTPYLQSVIDRTPSACDTFYGHGVGLAGKGAQHMASRGVDYKNILEYYYPGATVSKL